MCRAAQAATKYYYAVCENNPNLIGPHTHFTLRDVRNSTGDLENTYFIRIFAIFEAALRDFWKNGCGRSTRPGTYVLLDSIAARRGVPRTLWQNAQDVREYRNKLVHEEMASFSNLPLAQGRSYLGRFLSYLPQSW